MGLASEILNNFNGKPPEPGSLSPSSSLFSGDTHKICESRHGNWHYHLCHRHSSGLKGLCGAETMPCHAPIRTWGFKPDHMPASYCRKCEKLASP